VHVRGTTCDSVAYSPFVRHVDYGSAPGDFRTEDKACVTSAAIRHDPVADRCSPSELGFAPADPPARYRFGISEMRYFAANRRCIGHSYPMDAGIAIS